MNRIANILCLINLPFALFGQDANSAIFWIPKSYIDSLAVNSTENGYTECLKPIELFARKDDKWYIQSFLGKFEPIRGNDAQDSDIYSFTGVSLNLKYFTRNEQDSINQIRYHIKIYPDSLVLQSFFDNSLIGEKNYIKQFKGYKFEELRKTRKILLMQGIYDVHEANFEKFESGIEISPAGVISGSRILVSYVFERIGIPNEFIYDLVDFQLKDGSTKKVAMIYNAKNKTWTGYDYQIENGSYTIPDLSKYVFQFRKIQKG